MDPFIGQIQFFPYTYAPRDWLRCNGALLAINQHTALYSLIGIEFGGNGQTTFALPDLRDANPFGADSRVVGYCIALQGIYPTRD